MFTRGYPARTLSLTNTGTKWIWLVVWNIFYFSMYWECHHPNWLIFFRGVGQPPTRDGWWWLIQFTNFEILSLWFVRSCVRWMPRHCRTKRAKNLRAKDEAYPRSSMYGIFTYIYPINDPNVGKYTIHGWSGDTAVKPVIPPSHSSDATSWHRLRSSSAAVAEAISSTIWLVVTGTWLLFHIQLGMLSSQLTNSYFSEGFILNHQPDS